MTIIIIIFLLVSLICGFVCFGAWVKSGKKQGKSLWQSFWEFFELYNKEHPLMAPVFNFVAFLPAAAIIALILYLVYGG